MFGPAKTERLPDDDGATLVDALSIAEPDQDIIIDRCGDLRRPCWGAVALIKNRPSTALQKTRRNSGGMIILLTVLTAILTPLMARMTRLSKIRPAACFHHSGMIAPAPGLCLAPIIWRTITCHN